MSCLSQISTYSEESKQNKSFEEEITSLLIEEEDLKIVHSINNSLLQLINENEFLCKIGEIKKRPDIFYLPKIPDLSLINILKRLLVISGSHISVLISTIIHLDNFCDIQKYTLFYDNIYSILVVTFILTTKFNEDVNISFKDYANLIGISPKEMALLEITIIGKLNSKLYIESDYYQSYYEFFYRKK